jgi:HK97 family phage major capsid protein
MDPTILEKALAERDKAVLDRLEAFDKKSGERFEEMIDRIEELEARKSAPGKTLNERDGDVHMKLFRDWVFKPQDSQRKQALGEFQDKLIQQKYINIGTGADGAFAVPEVIARDIEKAEIKASPVRNLVKVMRSSSGDFKHLMGIGGAAAGWVGETDSRTATNTPQLRERGPTFGEVYAYPKLTEWASDDIFFDVKQWLVDEVSEQFAYQEGVAVISGNGTNKPTGMLNTAPVATADDAVSKRDAAAYQFMLSGDNSPASIDGDALIDLTFLLNAKYRKGASWAMNSNTAAQLSKLKASGTGEYLWRSGLVAGQPDTLLGKPVEIWEQMPDPNGGACPIAFGNFQRGYLLVDRTDLRITLDNVTEPGFIKFYCRRRVGGCVLNNDAVKFLKLL